MLGNGEKLLLLEPRVLWYGYDDHNERRAMIDAVWW